MAQQPRQFGKYLLLDRIQWGGMAEIWRACLQDGSDAIVAIKCLLRRVAGDPEMVAMFINEARIAVQLAHPNIAQVFDLGRVGNDFYIAMEYVAGVDLLAVFRAGHKTPIPIPLLAMVAAQLCDALDFAHRRTDADGRPMGLIHRDVSPDNCLVTFDGGVKLIDFGVAKLATQEGRTRVGVVKGKLSYMSPEQVMGEPMDRRADLFSLSVVLYEMVTGRRLFRSKSELETLKAVCHAQVVSPRELNPNVPAELARVIMRGLSRDKAQRFQWASEMASALRVVAAKAAPAPSAKLLEQFLHVAFPAEVAIERQRREAWAKDHAVGHKPAPWDEPDEVQEFEEVKAPSLPITQVALEPISDDQLDEIDIEVVEVKEPPRMVVPEAILRAVSPALPPPLPSPKTRVVSAATLARLGLVQPELEGDFEIERLTSLALEISVPVPTTRPDRPRAEPSDPDADLEDERPTQPVDLSDGPQIAVEGRYWQSAKGAREHLTGALRGVSGNRVTVRTASAIPVRATVELLVHASAFKNVMVQGIARTSVPVGREHEIAIDLELPSQDLMKLFAREGK